MKIIELLNKIANYEETPVKIKFKGKEYEWSQEFYDYKCIDINHKYLVEDLETEDLNRMCEEIPIIEDKKIEKCKNYCCYSDFINDNDKEKFYKELQNSMFNLTDKINEIIDYLNKEE